MSNSKKLLASPLSNKIYLATAKDTGNGNALVTGKKEDYTDEAINAVFQHMFYLAEKTGFYEYEYPSQGKVQFVRAGKEWAE